MQSTTFYINTEPANRSYAFVAGSGSLFSTPILSTNLIFADILDLTIQLLNKYGSTGSLNYSGSTATFALGNKGQPALCLSTCSLASSSSFHCPFGLNTFELSQSMGSDDIKAYTLELQIISGSTVTTYQNDCTVTRDIVVNALVPLAVTYIVSASFASSALSSSYALTASYAYAASVAASASYLKTPSGNVSVDESGLVVASGSFKQTIVTTNGIAMDDSGGDRIIQLLSNWGGPGDNLNSSFLHVPLGIGINDPSFGMLNVNGGIYCHDITSSKAFGVGFLGTSSWANNAVSSSYAVSASYAPTPVSVSYASNTSTASGIIYGDTFAYNAAFINSYTSSITCSNADNGKLINLITGSRVYLTGSLSSTFNCLVYQSGSGTVVITGSDASVIVRNRQGFKTIGGQYGVVSIVRLPNSDFVLSGDLS